MLSPDGKEGEIKQFVIFPVVVGVILENSFLNNSFDVSEYCIERD